MSLDRAVMAFAGFMVLLSLALAHFHSEYWLLLTVFVGLNLIQASLPSPDVRRGGGVSPLGRCRLSYSFDELTSVAQPPLRRKFS